MLFLRLTAVYRGKTATVYDVGISPPQDWGCLLVARFHNEAVGCYSDRHLAWDLLLKLSDCLRLIGGRMLLASFHFWQIPSAEITNVGGEIPSHDDDLPSLLHPVLTEL